MLRVSLRHRAEIELRTAAMAFARLGPVKDGQDRDGQRTNRRLLLAAVRYARTLERRP